MEKERVLKSVRLERELADFVEWYGERRRVTQFSAALRMILGEALNTMPPQERIEWSQFLKELTRANRVYPTQITAESLSACPKCRDDVGFVDYGNGKWNCQLCGAVA